MNDANELNTDEVAMYQAGAVKLPAAANKFGQAATELHKTAMSDSHCFKPVGPGEGTSDMQTQWTTLRNKIQDEILVPTRNNLVKAGDALVKAGEHYSQVDESHKTALEKAKQEHDDPNTPGAKRPPPYVSEAPTTDDPHPEETGPVR